jgi:hypothetical protein
LFLLGDDEIAVFVSAMILFWQLLALHTRTIRLSPLIPFLLLVRSIQCPSSLDQGASRLHAAKRPAPFSRYPGKQACRPGALAGTEYRPIVCKPDAESLWMK